MRLLEALIELRDRKNNLLVNKSDPSTQIYRDLIHDDIRILTSVDRAKILDIPMWKLLSIKDDWEPQEAKDL